MKPGLDDWEHAMVGDRIHAEITVQGKRATKWADRGIVTLAFEVRNQRGEVVQKGSNELMVLRRSGA